MWEGKTSRLSLLAASNEPVLSVLSASASAVDGIPLLADVACTLADRSHFENCDLGLMMGWLLKKLRI